MPIPPFFRVGSRFGGFDHHGVRGFNFARHQSTNEHAQSQREEDQHALGLGTNLGWGDFVGVDLTCDEEEVVANAVQQDAADHQTTPSSAPKENMAYRTTQAIMPTSSVVLMPYNFKKIGKASMKSTSDICPNVILAAGFPSQHR